MRKRKERNRPQWKRKRKRRKRNNGEEVREKKFRIYFFFVNSLLRYGKNINYPFYFIL